MTRIADLRQQNCKLRSAEEAIVCITCSLAVPDIRVRNHSAADVHVRVGGDKDVSDRKLSDKDVRKSGVAEKSQKAVERSGVRKEAGFGVKEQ